MRLNGGPAVHVAVNPILIILAANMAFRLPLSGPSRGDVVKNRAGQHGSSIRRYPVGPVCRDETYHSHERLQNLYTNDLFLCFVSAPGDTVLLQGTSHAAITQRSSYTAGALHTSLAVYFYVGFKK
jgi:hypothetical protein